MFEFKITDLKDAPAIGLGWATKTVSLLDTSGIANPFFGEGHQKFIFDDLESEKEECHRPGMQHAPKMKDVMNILTFTETFTDEDKVLIHCHAGKCRSPAVAMLALVQHGMDFQEAADLLVEVRHCASTNLLIIRLGDIALGLNGELLSFMQEWDEMRTKKMIEELDNE